MAGGGPSDRTQVTINPRHQWQPGEESGMIVQRIIGRFGLQLLWCALGAMLALSPDTASADECADPGSPCDYQLQAAATYNGWQTQTPVYACTAGTTFDEGETAWQLIDTTLQCFTVIEQLGLEAGPVFTGLVTNWCTDKENFQIQICCCPPVD
jgi:hypothetical protein